MSPTPELDLHPACLPLAFLLGSWRGEGVGGYPSIEGEDFRFVQELTFGHAGKPYLTYESRSWLLDEHGQPTRQGAAETGYWRAVGGDDIEVLLAHPTGFVEVWYGTVSGARIELATDAVVRTATAKEVTAGHRLYGMVDGDLAYAYDMAAEGQELQPHTSARLRRA